VFTTVSSHGFIDLENGFFQDLGSNGRRCVSCHVPTSGWTVTPRQLQETFEETDGGAFDDGLGLGAVFRTNDGSNSPKADVSTKAKRRQAYSMLLNKGLIRVGLPVPATAEFELIGVDDPYQFASAAELSLFRRPLPTANLKFDSTVMWDGREVVPGSPVVPELQTQSSDATTGHAKGQPLSQAQRESIAQFETEIGSAQIWDNQAGDLRAAGAEGGPDAILAQPFYVGINDNFGDSQTHAAFSPVVFNLFDRWTNIVLVAPTTTATGGTTMAGATSTVAATATTTTAGAAATTAITATATAATTTTAATRRAARLPGARRSSTPTRSRSPGCPGSTTRRRSASRRR
jgi:hypothetical protein